MDMLFAADSPWNWDAEKTFEILKAQNAGNLTKGKEVDRDEISQGGYADNKLGQVYIDSV